MSTVRPTKDFFDSDTNTTSYVDPGVDAAGGATFATDPFAFFDAIRDGQRHGWGYTWGFQTTDANSTALVIQAYRRRRHAGPGRRARGTAEVAGPRVWRLVVHVDRARSAPTRTRARRSARSSVCCNGRCRWCRARPSARPRRCAGLRVAAMRAGRARSLTIALAVVLGAIAPVLASPGIACAAALSAGRTPRWWSTRARGPRRTASRWMSASVSGTHLIELASAAVRAQLPARVRRPRRVHARRASAPPATTASAAIRTSGGTSTAPGPRDGRGRPGAPPTTRWATATARRGRGARATAATSHGAPPATTIDDACGVAPSARPEPLPVAISVRRHHRRRPHHGGGEARTRRVARRAVARPPAASRTRRAVKETVRPPTHERPRNRRRLRLAAAAAPTSASPAVVRAAAAAPPPSSGPPVAGIVALGAIALLGAGGVVAMRRRRGPG